MIEQIPKIVATATKQVAGETGCHFWGTITDCIIPHVGTVLIWFAAVFTENPAIEIMAGAFTGALAMGWAFAAASEKGTRADVFRRCGIHGCFGLFWGIFLTYHYGGANGPFPLVPYWAIAGLSSGLSGFVMAALVPALPGMIRTMARRVVGKEAEPVQPDATQKKPGITGDQTQRIQ